jgi:hypothetical protein
LAERDELVAGQEQAIERLKRRLDILDHRLDDVDSVVSAVIERVMKQPMSFSITCPHCGKNIEIALSGIQKPTV